MVGGYHYYVDTDDLLRHPASYFAHMLKDEWNKDKTAAVTINRNGKVFRYVSYYLFTGNMNPRRKPIIDLDFLLALRMEADFYGLPELVRLCDASIEFSMSRVFSSPGNIGLSSMCVRANEERATDALVVAMNIFRPSTVATSRLESYRLDSLQHYHKSVLSLLESERTNPYSLTSNCSHAHKCTMVNENSFSHETISKMYDTFSTWPSKMGNRVSYAHMERPQIYVFETEGYCASRVAVSLACGNIQGVYLYIFNSEHTGGRVTTKVNGEEVSIEKPGECMALLPGCSYSVETVISGVLVLFQCPVSFYSYSENDSDTHSENGSGGGDKAVDGDVSVAVGVDIADGRADDGEQAPLVWRVHDLYSTDITTARSDALSQAINTALETYTGVVICLSLYYSAGHSTNHNRRCETDPAVLKGFDVKLHGHLSNLYEVTVVTVAINTEKEGDGCTARVLDFSHDADMSLKVVAPMQSVGLDRGRRKTMLLTGLLCFMRS